MAAAEKWRGEWKEKRPGGGAGAAGREVGTLLGGLWIPGVPLGKPLWFPRCMRSASTPTPTPMAQIFPVDKLCPLPHPLGDSRASVPFTAKAAESKDVAEAVGRGGAPALSPSLRSPPVLLRQQRPSKCKSDAQPRELELEVRPATA